MFFEQTNVYIYILYIPFTKCQFPTLFSEKLKVDGNFGSSGKVNSKERFLARKRKIDLPPRIGPVTMLEEDREKGGFEYPEEATYQRESQAS